MHNILIVFRAILIGIITGIIVSIPPGPAGMESIKRTMRDGLKSGLIFITGSLCADICYFLITSVGMSQLEKILDEKTKSIFFIISGIIILIVSISPFFQFKLKRKCDKDKYLKKNSSIIYSVFIAFILTILSPVVCGTWIMLSSMAINLWSGIGEYFYYTYLISILIGMFIWFYGINYLAYKGKQQRFMTNKLNNTIKIVLDIVLIIISIVCIIYGVYILI